MVFVIPAAQKRPSFSSQLGSELGQGIRKGVDFATEIRRSQESNKAQSQMAKEQEKINTVSLGLDTVAQMESILEGGHLGKTFGINSLFNEEARTSRAMYEQLGRSLIPLVSAGVPIRNQKEFEEYKKVITDPNAFEGDIKGALQGLKSLLESSLAQKGKHPLERGEKEKSISERPALSSFHR